MGKKKPEAPQESTPEPKKAKSQPKEEPKRSRAAVDKRLKMVSARHGQLPKDFLDRMGKCETAGQVKRMLRDYLQAQVAVAEPRKKG
jgi:hypothetical protein